MKDSRTKSKQPPVVPWYICLFMKMTCVFYQRRVVAPRRCLRCQLFPRKELFLPSEGTEESDFVETYDLSGQGYDLPDEQMTVPGEEKYAHNCTHCTNFWWNNDGDALPYTDEDIGIGYWNHRGSWIVSVLLLLAVNVANVYEFVKFVEYHVGKPYFFINDVSFLFFMLELSIYPVMSLYSKMRASIQQKGTGVGWYRTLNARYIIKRFQFIDFHGDGCPGKLLLFLCYAWPLGVCIHRLYIYSRYSDCPTHRGYQGYKLRNLSFTLVLMLIWTNVHYILYLCRISLLRQFKLVQRFVERHEDDVDACRQVIWDVAFDFSCYLHFVYIFMILTLPFCTWGLTAVVCMQYKQGLHAIPCPNILWMLWSQKLMFYVITYCAQGGLDVSYMWHNFGIQIFTICHSDSQPKFWRSMKRHFDYIGVETNPIHWTMSLSLLSAYVAVYTSGS